MTDEQQSPANQRGDDSIMQKPLTRRRFLLGSAAVGVGGLVAGKSLHPRVTVRERPRAHSAPAIVNVKRGGTLTVGSIGSTTDSLTPQLTDSNLDLQRLFNLFDNLTYFPNNALDLQYGLAESIELSDGATVATIRLRSGVTWHNGKPLTADDVMYTFRRVIAPTSPHKGLLASLTGNAMTKMDTLTLRCKLKYSDAIFPERLYPDQCVIVPTGFTAKKPVGTGPFMYKSFRPGQRSVFVRNPNYWISGQPYLDEVVIIDLSDSTAQINALLSGEVDAIDSVPLNETSAIKSRSNLRLLEANGGYFQPITMRVDKAPFNDVRVRQAMRLIVNRPQEVAQAYNGFAVIGNDMPGPSDPAYPHTFAQRHQDIDQAKSLLKAAGHSSLSLKLVTETVTFGLIPSAEVMIQNAKAAGVTITMDELPPSVYTPKFLTWTFTQTYWGNKPFGIFWSQLYTPGGIFNASHFDTAHANSIFDAALKDATTKSRNDKYRELYKILYDTGGHIIHTFRETVDAYSTKFTGFLPTRGIGWSLGSYRYRQVSLA
jgi:peptide/nickel transport system substrate-binding protein